MLDYPGLLVFYTLYPPPSLLKALGLGYFPSICLARGCEGIRGIQETLAKKLGRGSNLATVLAIRFEHLRRRE